MDDLEDLFQKEEIIISFSNKMRQHKDGMLHTHQFQRVMDLYRRHLTPRYYEKKNLGQVFTPFILIDKILDQIPPEFMSDPNSTFLDPSAGMGGFLVVIHNRLMASLAEVIPNRTKRHNHIVSKMLYAAEITGNNVALMRKVFGDNFHVYHGDALTMDIKKEFGLDGFRVIVGNPPFEKPQEEITTKRGGGDSLWPLFVHKCLTEWLLPHGYFGMLLPPGWRKPSDEKTKEFGLWKLMTVKNTPKWIEMYDNEEASSYFDHKVSIRVDLVVIEKKKNRGFKTRIRGTDNKKYKQEMNKMPFLPNANLKKWMRIMTVDDEEGVKVLYSSSAYESRKKNVKKERIGSFKYPVIHSILKDGEIRLFYTDRRNEKGGFGVPKVVFNRLGNWNKPFLDEHGNYGMTQSMFAIPIRNKKEGEQMIRFFTPLRLEEFGADLYWSTSQPNIDWKLFHHLKKRFWRHFE